MSSNPTVPTAPAASSGSSVSLAAIKALPKVSLHDHLDGGLRAATLLELAAEIGHELPASTPDGLANWIYDAASSGSLERYLETFAHTVAVLQTPANLRRVAREYVADLAADGVVYGETRWAPEQHLTAGMTLPATVEAVRDGLAEGMVAAAAGGQQIEVRQLLTAMRHVAQPSLEIAALAVSYRDQGVVGFDIAGAEAGFPPSRFGASFEYLRRNNFRFTIHAGEAAGLESIAEAVQICGANRIGHGVRLVEDISFGAVEDISSGAAGEPRLGELAAYVRDQRIPLELCPSSNVQTGAAPSIAEHPIDLLRRLRFRVTVNTDNRLMSRTTLTREFALLTEAFGWGLDDIRALTINAAKSAFLPFDQRVRMIEDVIKPVFADRR